ncbi:MAG: hypothetical protein PHW52_00100 [Candidatus Pacebacteria bacterium]|nr:hypothetical protein [Candidatus Paceibacterota bacterium]
MAVKKILKKEIKTSPKKSEKPAKKVVLPIKKVVAKKKVEKTSKAVRPKKEVKKEIVKKVMKKPKEKKLGLVTHYFDKAKVVVLKLSSELEVGDKIRIEGGLETDFKQKVASMEIKGERIKKAKKGQEIGLKVKEKVRVGYRAYKIEEDIK